MPKSVRTVAELNEKSKITLRMIAAWMFTKDPYLTDMELDAEFDKADCPHDKFTRKAASHYRTLFKQGRLPPCPEEDPRGR